VDSVIAGLLAVATQTRRAKREPPDWPEYPGTHLAGAGIGALSDLSFAESGKTLTSILFESHLGVKLC
jgi:hypothetical protein